MCTRPDNTLGPAWVLRRVHSVAGDSCLGWDKDDPVAAVEAALKMTDIVERLREELELERMRLAACGVVALSDTPDSAAWSRKMHPDYESASCSDVARRVDECMRLREEVKLIAAQEREACAKECDDVAYSAKALSARYPEDAVEIGRIIGAEHCAQAIREREDTASHD